MATISVAHAKNFLWKQDAGPKRQAVLSGYPMMGKTVKPHNAMYNAFVSCLATHPTPYLSFVLLQEWCFFNNSGVVACGEGGNGGQREVRKVLVALRVKSGSPPQQHTTTVQ